MEFYEILYRLTQFQEEDEMAYQFSRAGYRKRRYTGKRTYGQAMGYSGGRAAKRFKGRRRYRKFRVGRDRKVGYYGRFSGPGSTEYKFLDAVYQLTPIALGFNTQNLAIVPIGTGESERIGRKITVKQIHVRGRVQFDSSTNVNLGSVMCRFTILQDTQTNGATFTNLEWLAGGDFMSFNNLINSGRFRVLKSTFFALNVTAGAGDLGTSGGFAEHARWFKCYVDCNIPIEYSGDNGNIAEQKMNSIWLVIQVDSVNVASVDFRRRIRYSDR